jgi:23S rRNA pseudouridine955/2504/2580 synthase
VVNKPAGLASHGENSLETLVCAYLQDRVPQSLSFKPGPLHRLDKPTSGVIAFSTSLSGARLFSAMMKEGAIHKTYLAIFDGIIPNNEHWEDFLLRDEQTKKTIIVKADKARAKKALTDVCPIAPIYAVNESGEKNGKKGGGASRGQTQTLARVEIGTGRTHQIRACAAARGHPLAGDAKYGSKTPPPFYLHAHILRFPPENPFAIHEIIAPLPEAFATLVC